MPVLPGATIGFLGGGQLGRMAAMAARSLGYDVQVLDPDPACPARASSNGAVIVREATPRAAAQLAGGCDVVTLEIEQIAPASLDAVGRDRPLRPGRDAVYVVQDRARQKNWLRDAGFPVGAYRVAESAADVAAAVGAFGSSIAKATTGGYDGRGQVRLADPAEAEQAWASLGARRCVVEQHLEVRQEISVLTARRPGGETAVFPPALNHHDHGILTWSALPAPIAPDLTARAVELGRAVTVALDVVGLLAVEMFVLDGGTLLVNELAPRPHNTFHTTERACETSQFEQLVRAVCDLPLGATETVRPGAIVNLLGDLWRHGEPPRFARALEVPGIRLHLYGKASARPGRKMGHLSALAASPEAARDLVLEAFGRL
jgi:5-(carboxyamino)imidazole ribonucleotide synthase